MTTNTNLKEKIESLGLTPFTKICNQLIKAFDGFPELENDAPEVQIDKFLQKATRLPSEERATRFKHELSRLRALECRAYKLLNNEVVFFDPFSQTFGDFSADADVEAYSVCGTNPPQDIALTKINHLLQSCSAGS